MLENHPDNCREYDRDYTASLFVASQIQIISLLIASNYFAIFFSHIGAKASANVLSLAKAELHASRGMEEAKYTFHFFFS